MVHEKLKKQIIRSLRRIHPHKVIIFGSQARGDIHEHSDIDLIVVVDSDHYPQTFKEKMDIYLPVSRMLSEIREDIPIDLLVYTRPMFDKLVSLNSMFSKEIQKTGVVLYEENT